MFVYTLTEQVNYIIQICELFVSLSHLGQQVNWALVKDHDGCHGNHHPHTLEPEERRVGEGGQGIIYQACNHGVQKECNHGVQRSLGYPVEGRDVGSSLLPNFF